MSSQWIIRIPVDYDEPDFIIAASSEAKAREMAESMGLHASSVEEVMVDQALVQRTLWRIGVSGWPRREPDEEAYASRSLQLPDGRWIGGDVLGGGATVWWGALATYEDQGRTLPYVDLYVVGTDRQAVQALFAERFTEIETDWPAYWHEHASPAERDYLASKTRTA